MHPVKAELQSAAKMFGCLSLLAAFFSFFIVNVAIKSNNPWVFAGVLFGALPVIVLLIARRYAIDTIDDRGVTLRNGTHYPWAELVSVQSVTVIRNRSRQQETWASFRRGTVKLRAGEYKNPGDLESYLRFAEQRRSRS